MNHPKNPSENLKSAPKKNAPFFVPGEEIILTRNGIWLADGVEITHQPTQLLFSKNLKKDGEGYFIQVGYEAKRIQVEDTPYFVNRLEKQEGEIILHLNDETQEILSAQSLKYSPGRLICKVHGEEEAKFLHAAYFDLLKDLQEDDHCYYLLLPSHQKWTRIELSQK